MQALRSLAAPDMLGGQLLLQRGLVPGLVSLIRPQHLACLAAWEERHDDSWRPPRSRTVPGLVAAILQDGIVQSQSTVLRDIFQVCAPQSMVWTTTVIQGKALERPGYQRQLQGSPVQLWKTCWHCP